MAFYVLAYPEEQATASLVEQTAGQPSLIAEIGDSQIAVQLSDHPDAARLAAKFAWDLAKAATEFATRCQQLTSPYAPAPGKHAELIS